MSKDTTKILNKVMSIGEAELGYEIILENNVDFVCVYQFSDWEGAESIANGERHCVFRISSDLPWMTRGV